MPPIQELPNSSLRTSIIAPRAPSFDSINENVFGLTALIVALVALGTTTLQVLHQYFSTAEGYRRCHKSVMGLWATGSRRKLRWLQFRMEVLFETPVMFTAPPGNKFGPIKGRPILYLKGTKESFGQTQVEIPEAQVASLTATTQRVHTADDERASWVTLLSTLQNAEYYSRKWDSEQRSSAGSNTTVEPYGLEVALQKKTRSWDFLPPSVTKPYASSTVCHLVEFMAMLGLHWKVFNENEWILRAEGNGFILTSTAVIGLGVMVVFEKTGKSDFEDRRVIPCMGIKDLCFGNVQTIFNNKKYQDDHPDAQSLDLVMGEDDVSETLETLGLLADTIKLYSTDHKHIFSLSFEIIGMLGEVFRPKGSSFRMLPNPTSDPWLKNAKSKSSWEMTRCLQAFLDNINSLKIPASDHAAQQLVLDANRLSNLRGMVDADIKLSMRETIHDIINHQTDFLLSCSQTLVLEVVAAHITAVTKTLAEPSSPLNSATSVNKEQILMREYFTKIRPTVSGLVEGSNIVDKAEMSKAEERETIWLCLILRMLCWLTLHDFDKSDTMIVPSELRGSRMPIYIG